MSNSNKNWIVASDLRGEGCEHPWRFVVPIYQRVFTWGRREVERLLLDLYRHFVEEKEESDYYLGVITVVGAQVADGSRDPDWKLVLVDGQQRLTCLMLLGALLGWDLCDDFLRYEARPADEEAKGKIITYFKELFKTGCSMADEEVLEKVANERGQWETSNQAMNDFIRCAVDLRDENGKRNEKGDPVRVLLKLHEKASTIASHLKLFISELPKDPYVRNLNEQNKYFEKMNAGGRQLEPHEILKVRICGKHKNPTDAFSVWNQAIDFSKCFKELRDKNVHDDQDAEIGNESLRNESLKEIVEKAKKKDDQFEEKIGKEPQDSGENQLPTRSGLISVEMFLLHVLAQFDKQTSLNSGWREDKLLDAFPEVSEIDEEWADKFVEEMKNYRSFLDKCIIHLKLDSENAYEYCFETQNDDEEADDKARRKSKQFQTMLFVSDRGKHGKQEWLLKAYREKGRYCDATSGMVSDFAKQLECLKDIDKECATKDQRRLDYVNELCYSDQSRWLFWRLDYLLWERVEDAKFEFCMGEFGTGDEDSFIVLASDDVSKIRNFRFHGGRSIEHLHPQTDGGDVLWADAKDMFGNLCLLTPALNSALSNDSVAVKLARIKDLKGATGLQSVKMLFMYKECHGRDFEWTPEAAKRHLARMKNVLKGSYLYQNAE